MTAALGQIPESVTVSLTHVGVFEGQSVRLEDEVFIQTSLMEEWGWKATRKGGRMDVEAEGREFPLAVRTLRGKPHVSLSEAAKMLGAVVQLDSEKKVASFLARLRNIEPISQGLRIDATLSIKPNVFRLSHPDRLILDIPGAVLDEHAKQGLPPGVRVGQFKPDVVRVVLDGDPTKIAGPLWVPGRPVMLQLGKKDPVAIEPGAPPSPPAPTPQPQPKPTSEPIRVGFPSVTTVSPKQVVLRSAITGASASSPSARYLTPNSLEISIPNARLMPDTPTVLEDDGLLVSAKMAETDRGNVSMHVVTRDPTVFQLGIKDGQFELTLSRPEAGDGRLAGKVVVLDAGHGGRDPGANAGGANEKTIVLAITRMVAEELGKMGVSVLTTRGDDRFIPLSERAAIANRSRADLFISIHANSNTVADSRSGSMTFFHKFSPVGMLLAECIQTEIAKVKEIPDLGTVSDTRIYKSGFAVLRESTMPSVLIETGFVNHARDRAALTNPQVQRRLAQAIARGIRVFIGNGSS